MPKVMEYNYEARKAKYDEAGMLIGGTRNGVAAFTKLLEDLEVPMDLGSYGIGKNDIPAIVAESRGGSRNYNPVPHTDETVQKMLLELL